MALLVLRWPPMVTLLLLRLRPLTKMTRRFIWHYLMVHAVFGRIRGDDFGWRIYARP